MRRAVAALACAVAPGGCGEEESGGSLSKAEDVLAELGPPPDIARPHAMFVEGLRATADDAEKLVRALRAGDERRAEAILDNGTLVQSAAAIRIGRPRLEFSEKVYDLGEVSEFP
jgi:hypothetical protein